jgi:hypothetical protein
MVVADERPLQAAPHMIQPAGADDRHVLRRGDVVAGGQFGFAQQLEDFDEITSWRSQSEAATHAVILSCGQQLGRCSRTPRQEMGCLGPEALKSRHGGSCRIHFTVNCYVFPLPTFVISKKDSAATAMCARHFLRWFLMSSPSVGFFRAVNQDLLPEKSRPEAGLENSHRRREEV